MGDGGRIQDYGIRTGDQKLNIMRAASMLLIEAGWATTSHDESVAAVDPLTSFRPLQRMWLFRLGFI